MRYYRLFIIAAINLVCSCGEDRGSPADSQGSSLPGIYAGKFPCQNCPGIQVTLWLRPDGRFFIRQRYLEDAERDEVTTYNLGRWSWAAADDSLELRGAGPRRIFTQADRHTLLMRTGSDLEHRLSRQSTAPDFKAAIRMTGMMQVTGSEASFTECLTGLAAPVAENRELLRFRRQYRRIDARGAPVFVEFEGRFAWSQGSSLESYTIERFVSIKEQQTCRNSLSGESH